MALQPWLKGIVVKIVNETADTKRFWIQIPEITSFDFEPGQFITLDLPIHEKPHKRWRSYSIASWPDRTNVIELLIVLNPNGAGTPYLFNEIKVGSELTLRGPQGVFTLKKPIDNTIFFICTGTGIAPFRSMINHIHRENIPYSKIYLIYGCRKRSNLMYYEELQQLQQSMPDFHYLPTLSREEWDGREGYVHHVYEEMCVSKLPSQFYLCGWKDMIDEAKQRILQMGYEKKDIHLEIYG